MAGFSGATLAGIRSAQLQRRGHPGHVIPTRPQGWPNPGNRALGTIAGRLGTLAGAIKTPPRPVNGVFQALAGRLGAVKTPQQTLAGQLGRFGQGRPRTLGAMQSVLSGLTKPRTKYPSGGIADAMGSVSRGVRNPLAGRLGSRF